MKLASRTVAALLATALVSAVAAPAEARSRGNGGAVIAGLAGVLVGALAVTAMSGNAQAAPAYGYQPRYVPKPAYPSYGYRAAPTYSYGNSYGNTYGQTYASYSDDYRYDRYGNYARADRHGRAAYRRGKEVIVERVTNPDTGEQICRTNYGRLGYCH